MDFQHANICVGKPCNEIGYFIHFTYSLQFQSIDKFKMSLRHSFFLSLFFQSYCSELERPALLQENRCLRRRGKGERASREREKGEGTVKEMESFPRQQREGKQHGSSEEQLMRDRQTSRKQTVMQVGIHTRKGIYVVHTTCVDRQIYSTTHFIYNFSTTQFKMLKK